MKEDRLHSLRLACKELAKESFHYRLLKEQALKNKEPISEEELYKTTQRGAWSKYLLAGGSRTMINRELSKEDDFGGQYDVLCRESPAVSGKAVVE